MCSFRFYSTNRTKDFCSLPSHKEDFCIFHFSEKDKELDLKLLFEEIKKPDHWLEGIIINSNLSGELLSNAMLPNAIFEGISISSTSFIKCNLEGSIFRSSCFEKVSFYGSNLKDSNFDLITFKTNSDYSIDFSYCEIGGVSLVGAMPSNYKLSNISISKQINALYFLKSGVFEKNIGDWRAAAKIFTLLGKRAKEDWDFSSEDSALFEAMTCRHRLRIKAGPLIYKNEIKDWLVPSIKAKAIGLGWYLHRNFWGYGHNYIRIVLMIVITILGFSFLFYLLGNFNLFKAFIFSLQSFFSMSYGTTLPEGKSGEIIGTFESFIGTFLISFFIVSLSAKYIRRI